MVFYIMVFISYMFQHSAPNTRHKYPYKMRYRRQRRHDLLRQKRHQLSPIFYLFQMFGLAPLLFADDDDDAVAAASNKFAHCLYNIYTLTIFLVSAYLTYLAVLHFNMLELPITFSPSVIFQVGLVMIVGTTTILIGESRLSARAQLNQIEMFTDIDHILGGHFNCGSQFGHRRRKWLSQYGRKFYRRAMLVAALYAGGCISFYSVSSSNELFWLLFSVSIGNMTIYLRMAQLMMAVDMLTERFRRLNIVLEAGVRGASLSHRKMNALQRVYGLCWKISNDINRTIGWAWIGVVLHLIFDLINTSHIFYLNIVIRPNSSVLVAGVIAFSGHILLPSILLARSCHLCYKMVSIFFYTYNILNHISFVQVHMTKALLHSIDSDAIRNDVRIMSLQMKHQTIIFEGTGFCSIDYKMINLVCNLLICPDI